MAERWREPKDADRKEMEDWIVSRGGTRILVGIALLIGVSFLANFVLSLF